MPMGDYERRSGSAIEDVLAHWGFASTLRLASTTEGCRAMSQRASSTSSSAMPDFRLHGVNPLGGLDADPACGTLMGNRGRLTDADGHRIRPWQGKDWITCDPFGPPAPGDLLTLPWRYTRLSFLDQATACAAGRRPLRKSVGWRSR